MNPVSCSTMANVVLQHSSFKKDIWNRLEGYMNERFMNHYVLTAVEYDNKHVLISNGLKIHVPVGFYKIVIKNEHVVFSVYYQHSIPTRVYTGKLPYFIKV